MPEYTLESAPDSLSRDTSVCRFSSGLPPFGAQFKLPVRSFHEELSEEEDDAGNFNGPDNKKDDIQFNQRDRIILVPVVPKDLRSGDAERADQGVVQNK